MIQFIEDEHGSYAHRTKENAKLAEVTLAFAVDFTTSGERLTEESARKYKRGYYAVNIEKQKNVDEFLEKYGSELQQFHLFNIAGNGLVRLQEHNLTQQYCDEIILYALRKLIQEYKVQITEIRSGGQSGADESGLKAAQKLGINAVCLLPNRWRFNNGKEEIEDEILFKERFVIAENYMKMNTYIKNIEELYTREEFALAAKIRDTYSCGYAPVALCSDKRVSAGYESGANRNENFTLKMWYAVQVWCRAVIKIKEATSKCCVGVKDAFTVEWLDTYPFRTLVYTNYQDWDYARITEELWQELQKIADSGEVYVCAGTFYNHNYSIECTEYPIKNSGIITTNVYNTDILPESCFFHKTSHPVSSETRTFSWGEIQDLFVKVPFRVQELIHGENLNTVQQPPLRISWGATVAKERNLLNVIASTTVTFEDIRYAVEVLHSDVNETYGVDCPNPDLRGLTALHMCFRTVDYKERKKIVEYLISKGADVNFFGYGGCSVLDEAYYCEDYDMITYLLEHGANPNYNGCLDDKDEFPVVSQIRSNILYMVDADCGLLKSKFDRKILTTKKDYEYEPAIVLEKALELRDLLIKHGAQKFVDENQKQLNWSVFLKIDSPF